jgi:predicted RND superfamily exporter protein
VLLAASAARRPPEVGYAAYFGPSSSEVRELTAFHDEFESGFHLLIAFGCRETSHCHRIDEPWALEFLGRLHDAADRLPNVRRTASALDSPVVVGPLETRTLATRIATGGWRLDPDWQALFLAGLQQPGFAATVVSSDARSAGVVVELRSLESQPVRDAVRGALALASRFERELGGEIHLAGDPVWTVVSADALERDSKRLTALMFAAMAGLLMVLLRDPWLAALPLVAIALVTIAVLGLASAIALPETSLLAALPPLLVTIAVAQSLHFLVAVARTGPGASPESALIAAARGVGDGCLWSSITTIAGFASFLGSNLASFRHFGALAGVGVALAFATSFTVLPALLCLRMRRSARPASARRRAGVAREVLDGIEETVARYPRWVVVSSLASFGLLALGVPRLQYASDFGFGEGSYVVRSLRAIEANFRKPMTTEVVVTLPPGRGVWEEPSLRLLAAVEEVFAGEISTGRAWSFLDLLEEAHRLDVGRAPESFAALVAAAPREMALVATSERTRWFWSEGVDPERSDGRTRARISVDRAWLDDAEQGPYVARVRAALAALERRPEAAGAGIELTGGLVLADRFIGRLRETQRDSFASAFAFVAATLVILLRRPPVLVLWAVAVNIVPVVALLGLMGWTGIGIDPANTMVGAILLGLGVDDTIHFGLRVRAALAAGLERREAVAYAFATVGEALLGANLCLAVGFSVLLFSQWGGLVSFGLLAGLGVGLLLAADLLLLPAALLMRRGGASVS